MLQISTAPSKVSAKLVQQDNHRCIVAAFKTSSPPSVWQYDLKKNHSFSLVVQGDEGNYELGITAFNGEFTSIAHFSVREDAEEAYNKVQKTLFKQHSSIKYRGTRALLYVVIALLLIFVVLKMPFANKKTGMEPSNMETSTVLERDAPNTSKIGVPLTADDVLTPPKN